MKRKVSREWTEQKNGGNSHHKYAIKGSNGTYLLLLLLLVLSFCYVSVDFVWIKTLPLHFYHRINARTFMVLKYTYCKKWLIKKSISKRGKNIGKRVKKTKNVCGMNPNKCPFLARFLQNTPVLVLTIPIVST